MTSLCALAERRRATRGGDALGRRRKRLEEGPERPRRSRKRTGEETTQEESKEVVLPCEAALPSHAAKRDADEAAPTKGRHVVEQMGGEAEEDTEEDAELNREPT